MQYDWYTYKKRRNIETDTQRGRPREITHTHRGKTATCWQKQRRELYSCEPRFSKDCWPPSEGRSEGKN